MCLDQWQTPSVGDGKWFGIDHGFNSEIRDTCSICLQSGCDVPLVMLLGFISVELLD